MLDIQVRRRGSYLAVDADNCIVKAASLATLDSRWLPPIAAIILACRANFGAELHSVYVGGSVASGEAVPMESDLDMYALVASSACGGSEWAKELATTIERQHPITNRLELICLTRAQLADHRELQQILKLFAVCVHGHDLSAQLPPVVLGPSLAWRAATLRYDITDAIAHLLCATNAARRREICRWVMKRVVRAAFTLVAQREHRYTMAIFPCYETFCRFYPQHREVMRRVAHFATTPTSDHGEAINVLTEIMSWMPGEASRVFGPMLDDVVAETFRKKSQCDAVSLGAA